MTVLRGLLGTYLAVCWVLCVIVYFTDGPELIVLVLVPVGVLLVGFGGVAIDGGNGVHMALLAAVALAEVAVIYCVALLFVPREPGAPPTSSEQM